MSTTPIVCPYCKKHLRVAVQASHISRTEAWPNGAQLKIEFHTQLVAHECEAK